MQVGHLVVPVLALRAAQVGPRNEALLTPHLELGLEDKRPVRLIGECGASVDEEERDGARASGDLLLEAFGRDGALEEVELETVGFGYRAWLPCAGLTAEWKRHRRFLRCTLPDLDRLAVAPVDLARLIVAPSHGHAEGRRSLRN